MRPNATKKSVKQQGGPFVGFVTREEKIKRKRKEKEKYGGVWLDRASGFRRVVTENGEPSCPSFSGLAR